jgi:hypothetical protein
VEATVASGFASVLAVTPLNGFMNAGSGRALLLANPQCPSPPVAIAAILILDAPT